MESGSVVKWKVKSCSVVKWKVKSVCGIHLLAHSCPTEHCFAICNLCIGQQERRQDEHSWWEKALLSWVGFHVWVGKNTYIALLS